MQKRYEEREAQVPKLDTDEILKDVKGEFVWQFGGNGFDERNESTTCASLKKRLTAAPKSIELVGEFAMGESFNIMILPMFAHQSQLIGTFSESRLRKFASVLANTYAFQMFPEKYDLVMGAKPRQHSQTPANYGIDIRLDCYSPVLKDGHFDQSLNDLVDEGKCYMGKLLNQAMFGLQDKTDPLAKSTAPKYC